MMIRFTLLLTVLPLVIACGSKKNDHDDVENAEYSISDEQPVVLQEAEEENPDSIITDDWGGNAEWKLAPSDTSEE